MAAKAFIKNFMRYDITKNQIIWTRLQHIHGSKASKMADMKEASWRKSSRGNIGGMGIFLLGAPVVTFCLGCWQVQRRSWKIALIKTMESKVHAEPVPFPDDISELKDLEYRKVTVRGHFDHSKELHMMPRAPVQDEENKRGGLISSASMSRTGAWIITPFQLADRDMRILINRGWVPRDKIAATKRPEGQITEEVELTGVVRHNEKRVQFGPANRPEKNHWNHRDLDAMSEVLDTMPIFLDATEKSSVPGGPLGGQTRVTLRNEHFSYIITWYSLSFITALMWYKRYIGR